MIKNSHFLSDLFENLFAEVEALTGSRVLHVYASCNDLCGTPLLILNTCVIFDGLPDPSQICRCFPSNLSNMHSNHDS